MMDPLEEQEELQRARGPNFQVAQPLTPLPPTTVTAAMSARRIC